MLLEKMELLGVETSFLGRYLNDGFSGGEKKRVEMLQLAVLAPKYAILDETDSGLDVDALKDVGTSVAALRASEEGQRTGFLIITHYPRILQHITPDVVHIMIDGRIVKTGGHDLAMRIEREGYDAIREETSALA
jgi:Fe-S cluster assembly ATP-binding protein